MGRYRDALPVAARVIAWDPTAAIGYIQRAEDLSMLDRHEEAWRALSGQWSLSRRVLDPGAARDTPCISRRATTRRYRRRVRAIILDPQNTTARIDLALTLEAMGRYKDAYSCVLREALRIMREIEEFASRHRPARVMSRLACWQLRRAVCTRSSGGQRRWLHPRRPWPLRQSGSICGPCASRLSTCSSVQRKHWQRRNGWSS